MSEPESDSESAEYIPSDYESDSGSDGGSDAESEEDPVPEEEEDMARLLFSLLRLLFDLLRLLFGLLRCFPQSRISLQLTRFRRMLSGAEATRATRGVTTRATTTRKPRCWPRPRGRTSWGLLCRRSWRSALPPW